MVRDIYYSKYYGGEGWGGGGGGPWEKIKNEDSWGKEERKKGEYIIKTR